MSDTTKQNEQFACQQAGVIEPFSYELPAIRIHRRCGDNEETLEFKTADDYKAWKELED